jgi:hypothetical protein
MSPLRKKMIGAMRQRGFSVRTHQSYLGAVVQLARFYRRSPDTLTVEEVQAFFAHLALERELSGASCRLYLNAEAIAAGTALLFSFRHGVLNSRAGCEARLNKDRERRWDDEARFHGALRGHRRRRRRTPDLRARAATA